MSLTKLTFSALVMTLAVGAGTAFAAPAAAPSKPAAHCVLTEHRVTSVQPLRVTQRYGRGTSERLVGARVLVQAEPGLTAEWLQLTIERHLARMNAAGMANCPLDAKDVRVSVASAGPGFAVNVTGKNAAQAEEILRRAQLLVR